MEENFGSHIESLVDARREATREFWKGLLVKESMLTLESRKLWLKDGDKNSRFFHNSIKESQRKNAISVLNDEARRVEGVEEVKREVKNHFEAFFKESDFRRAIPEGLDFYSLDEIDSAWLERPFLEEEVKMAAWDCDGSKSPGPDGYTLEFFQFFWETVKRDVMKFVENFHDKARLTEGCTSFSLLLSLR